MNISLQQWKEVEAAVRDLKKATETAEDRVFTIASRFPTGSPEFNLLFKLSNEIHAVREAAPAAYPYHPQSEWLGGDSDDPKNHTLREPNCCPLPHRKFTAEEIAEAGAVCHGPVQWEYHTPTAGVAALKQDNDTVTVALPDGRNVVLRLNDIEDDALPQLEIDLPAPMVANCWLDGMHPATPVHGKQNALKSNMIHIPIEKREA